MKNIFFDLDGTLINSQKRLYDLFCEISQDYSMNYEQYWEIKRNRISQKDFLKQYFNYSDDRINCFKKEWLAKIEESPRLDKDRPVPHLANFLTQLASQNRLYIVSHRQNTALAIQQIENFGWGGYFKEVFITNQRASKADLIKQVLDIQAEDVLISDTGEDIQEAKALGIKSIAVTWGILNKQILEKYNPDFIVDKVADFDKCPFL